MFHLSTNGGFSGDVTLSGAQATALLAGQLYINIHTSTNSGGEIRGQLTAVPEPSTSAALLAVGALGLAVLCRRARLVA